MISEIHLKHLNDVVCKVIVQLRLLATAEQTVGIHEFSKAVELWKKNQHEDIDGNVQIGVCCEEGDSESSEFFYCDIRVNESFIRFSTLRRSSSKEADPFSHSRNLAELPEKDGFYSTGVDEWYHLFENALRNDTCEVRVSCE